MSDKGQSPVRRVVKEELRTWIVVGVLVLLWVGWHKWL